MSSFKNSKKAIDKLNIAIEDNKFSEDCNINIILSLPRSDMGKGTIVAHLLTYLDDSDAIKFDGLLNTNANGRHTARGHDDFGIYEKYNPNKKFGDERYILGGYFYKNFIEEYGEFENLSFRPHLVKYFILTLGSMWNSMGKPKNVMIEIGGTVSDFEVDPFVTPAITYLKSRYKERVRVILLSELGFNNHYIKTKVAQNSIAELLKRMIIPDYLLVREPSDVQVSDEDRLEFERILGEKLYESFGSQFMPKSIISIPYYPQEKIGEMGEYLNKRLLPFLKD